VKKVLVKRRREEVGRGEREEGLKNRHQSFWEKI
jgi:hypothetical protein